MSKLTGYKCANCGQMLPIPKGNIFKCEYCGSEYERDDYTDVLKPLYVQVLHADVATLKSNYILDRYTMQHTDRAQDALEHAIENCANKMAEQLVPYIEWHTYTRPEDFVVVEGRLKVVRPDERITVRDIVNNAF